ncbi:hypothetical protein RIF29_21725 [Crotalaria pallida]|uniref:Uncharacterized protein n=1 Tax=Crotalaria pallida TaxID=3830 RepID=A0AAN9F7Z3_CROPI
MGSTTRFTIIAQKLRLSGPTITLFALPVYAFSCLHHTWTFPTMYLELGRSKRASHRQVQSNQSIKVSLFQEKAIEMYNFLSQGDEVKIVALHLARIQIYDGVRSLVPSWDTTKVMLNPQIPQARQLIEADEQLPMLTQAPSQAQSETSADIQLALSNPLYCKTVQEIREEKQVSEHPN